MSRRTGLSLRRTPMVSWVPGLLYRLRSATQVFKSRIKLGSQPVMIRRIPGMMTIFPMSSWRRLRSSSWTDSSPLALIESTLKKLSKIQGGSFAISELGCGLGGRKLINKRLLLSFYPSTS